MRIRKPSDSLKFSRVTLLLGFQMEFQEVLKMRLNGLGVTQVEIMQSSNAQASKISATGNLKLVQPIPL